MKPILLTLFTIVGLSSNCQGDPVTDDVANRSFKEQAPTEPILSIVDGDHQIGPAATFVAKPLVVKMMKMPNTPIVGAPVEFSTRGTGRIAASTDASVEKTLTVTTDATGYARVYYAGVLRHGAKGVIYFRAGSACVTFVESTVPRDPSVRPVARLKADLGLLPGEINLSWINHATNATYLIILKSRDSIHWIPVVTLTDATLNAYVVRGLDSTTAYYFGVIAGNPNVVRRPKPSPLVRVIFVRRKDREYPWEGREPIKSKRENFGR